MAPELEELSNSELRAAAEDIGLAPSRRETRTSLIERIRRRRAVIDAISREELARILRWAHVEVQDFNVKDVLVSRFYHVGFRKTDGLTLEDLRIVARMHEVPFEDSTSHGELAGLVQKQSGRWSEVFKRAGSRMVGFLARRIIGPDTEAEETVDGGEPTEGRVANSLKRGAKAALKFAVDDYVRDKLDEIEARIDHKLDDIDRKMNEWRTREIRHRLRILKITIVATVIVAAISLVYTLIKKYGM